MKYCQEDARIVSKNKITSDVFDFVISCSQSAALAQPGQFVNILADGFTLRRPISICEIGQGTLRLVMQVRGDGTARIAEKNVGDRLDIVAPLGHGFEIDRSKRAVLVGGGIGAPPLLELSKRFDACTAILGFRSADAMILQNDFEKNCETVITTDDGSAGICGFVTQPLEEMLRSGRADVVLSCGPTPMLRNVAGLCKKYGTPCQVSMEQRMACGVGACLVCACKTKSGMRHVCKNGPVFDAAEVKWDEQA
ncbi:MAG: dihydroorotate dehydrogenase electron transfer subunit [Clostridia bacterium]|nr:dihydroorotate dehydrogenase electron transfer subunit [Clostridia bacterium]